MTLTWKEYWNHELNVKETKAYITLFKKNYNFSKNNCHRICLNKHNKNYLSKSLEILNWCSWSQKSLNLPLCHTLQFTLREYIACQNTLYSYAIYGNTYYGVSNLMIQNLIVFLPWTYRNRTNNENCTFSENNYPDFLNLKIKHVR